MIVANRNVTLKANVRGYIAGMDAARVKSQRWVQATQNVLPLPVSIVVQVQSGDRPVRVSRRFGWLFRGRMRRAHVLD